MPPKKKTKVNCKLIVIFSQSDYLLLYAHLVQLYQDWSTIRPDCMIYPFRGIAGIYEAFNHFWRSDYG